MHLSRNSFGVSVVSIAFRFRSISRIAADSSVDEIRSVCPIVRVVGEEILEIFVFIFATEAAFFVSYTDLSNSDRFGDALRRDSLGIHLSAVFASVFRHGFLIVRGVRARTASLHGCKSARIPIVPPR